MDQLFSSVKHLQNFKERGVWVTMFLTFFTALPRSTLTVTPDSPVFTGETVNLTCVIESDHSDWRYEWYKGGYYSEMVQTSDRYTINRDTLTIRGATESDQGQYWCRGHIDRRSVSSQSSSDVSLSVKGELNIIVPLYYMYDHTSNQKTFSFSDVTFTLLINIIIYTSFEGLIV